MNPADALRLLSKAAYRDARGDHSRLRQIDEAVAALVVAADDPVALVTEPPATPAWLIGEALPRCSHSWLDLGMRWVCDLPAGHDGDHHLVGGR